MSSGAGDMPALPGSAKKVKPSTEDEQTQPNKTAWAEQDATKNEESKDEQEGPIINAKEQICQYADGTSIHGIKYTLEEGRTICEK